ISDPEAGGPLNARETLEFLGVEGTVVVPVKVLLARPEALLFDPKMVTAVVEALNAADGPVVICSDRSEAMDREGASGETGREVVWDYRKALVKKKLRLVGLAKRIEAIESSSDLDETTRSPLVAVYREALGELEKAEAAATRGWVWNYARGIK
ncbi:MAG: hypothetical protein IH786_03705, partial [Proteobacteria bacterium]|nr:hypothetical protein [Pseudomonadota bacterium]